MPLALASLGSVVFITTQPHQRGWESLPENARFAEQLADFVEGDDKFRNSRYSKPASCILLLVFLILRLS